MKARVLVFDDDAGIRSLLTAILLRRGYEVRAFPQPRSCPLFLDGDCPCPPDHTCADIILTDISMPGVTGLEFVGNQMRNGCKVKTWGVLSGSWSEPDLETALQLGCKTFSKPFPIDDVERWLDEFEESADTKRRLWAWPLQREESELREPG